MRQGESTVYLLEKRPKVLLITCLQIFTSESRILCPKLHILGRGLLEGTLCAPLPSQIKRSPRGLTILVVPLCRFRTRFGRFPVHFHGILISFF